MDDVFRCPDCHAEHQDVLDAILGHVARCLNCELLHGGTEVPVQFSAVRVESIRIDVHIAA